MIISSNKYKKYLAHISDCKKESLYEHTELVKKYFNKLIEKHQLEHIINNLIESLVRSFEEYKSIDKGIELVKKFFYLIPEYHDMGKINPNFQVNKMENNNFKCEKLNFGSKHSKVGAFLFMDDLFEISNNNFNSKEKVINLYLLLSFSYSILNHHSPNFYYKNEFYFDDDFLDSIFKINDVILLNYNKDNYCNFRKKYEEILSKIQYFKLNECFPLFALIKLNYSLLTASDYLATSHFMNEWDKLHDDFGILNQNMKEKIIINIATTKKYNKKIYKNLKNYTFYFPEEKSNENINILRQNLAVEIINNIKEYQNKNLFYIEAPTGSGKTNLSMLAMTELLRKSCDITKIFYVFPFTTLITQTYSSLKETLGLCDDEIVQIHSKSGFFQKNSDDNYGKENINLIDYLFFNYPLSLMSHVKFFDILKSDKKMHNYILHRLANSLVIIDELQAYSPKEWDKVIYFINMYSKYFNIKFILMSATLPKIDNLLIDHSFVREEFVLLNKKDKYFQNPNFKNRITFDFSLLSEEKMDKNNRSEYLLQLWEKIKIESEKYLNNTNSKHVYTLVEFIFKKTATEFIELVNRSDSLFDEVYLLSGTILESRRKEVISKINNQDSSPKNILLITTQVIEAGVDIDMDLGFKDSSIIDSEEQLAGRINRNVKKLCCKLFIFDLDDAKCIYGKDYRYQQIKEKLNDKYYEILENKNFDLLYQSVMDYKKRHNKQLGYVDNLPSYLKNIKYLKFRDIDKDFLLISNKIQTSTIYIPIRIPVDDNFSQRELIFLKEKNIYNDEGYVDGEKIWTLYCNIIENKDSNFTKKKYQQILMQGLVSKFSISLSTYSESMVNLIKSGNGEEKYGFYKLINVEDVYDYNKGVKELKFEDINFF